ncbi:MAG: alpha/beta fold hydrolase [Myxococcota bacterium]
MADLSRFFVPWGTYGALRDQLGSVRKIYVGRDKVLRRDDFGAASERVLLVHGFFQTRNLWDVMEDRLRFDGYSVMSFNLGGLFWRYNTHPIEKSAQLIAEKIEKLAEKHGFDNLHIIGHSKGGLIARKYVQELGGDARVKSVITLGTPHHGTPTAAIAVGLMGFGLLPSSARDLLPRSRVVRDLGRDRFPNGVPLTSIYSKQDLVCPWWCSTLHARAGSTMKNIAVTGIGHSELAWDAGVYRHVRTALEEASNG